MIKNITAVNVAATVSLQVITLLCGFVIPRFILSAFGSEVNGLVASLTQFLSYINLVEGGVGSVILANLYKPLANKDTAKASSVVATAERFFKRLAGVFVAYQVILAVTYPLFAKTAFTWEYVSSLTIILGLSTFIQYYFAITWRLFLQADKRMYVAVLAQGVAVVLNLIVTAVVIEAFPNVHTVKLLAGLAYFVQPVILGRYIKTRYALDDRAIHDDALLSQRWDGFGINLASMVHSTTATIVLTIMATLSSVSVFSIYMLVANGLKSLITSISAGLVPTIGQYYGKGSREECDRLFDIYDLLMFFVSFLCFTVAALSVAPFALIYTSGISDANYYQPMMGALLMLAECLFCIRDPYVNMAYSAGHFRQVSKYAYWEAASNIALSIVFTLKWGMIGVVLGLLVSITYRTIAQAYYLSKHILNRPMSAFFKKLLAFGLASSIAAAIALAFVDMGALSIANWAIYVLKVGIIELVSLVCVVAIIARKEFRDAFGMVNARRKSNLDELQES